MMRYKVPLQLSLCAGLIALLLLGPGGGFFAATQTADPPAEPKVIDPGPPGGPPSDAVILFDGKDLAKWRGRDGGEARWAVADGVMTVNGTGPIYTKESFGACQLHVEWATPAEVKGNGQGRGNSGVYLHSRYEVQVLDSFNNKTYFDGQAGAIYKHYPPLVNASRRPGEWQTYDIIFRPPVLDEKGEVKTPGSMTVLHNGVLVQDHAQLKGGGRPRTPAALQASDPNKRPLMLQDHRNPVRYRNIWIRPL
jgi:hypothetical protein